MNTPAQLVRDRKSALDCLRPLSTETTAALDRWYDVELTYTSNALEGNTLTRSETAIVLEKGITVSGKPLKDHLEATGHIEALGYMRDLAKSSEPVRELDIRNLHRLILGQVDSAEAGKYSNHERLISGSTKILPSPPEIPALMQQFIGWLTNAPPTPETAFDAHERLVSIHPFSDGNGRTARLLMNLLLLRQGFPPLVIVPEDRPAYHESLRSADNDDRAAYHGAMYNWLARSLDYTLRVLHAPQG
jgi:Fic family protein